MSTTVRQGGCKCGAVRYEISGDPLFVHACHCTDCQRASGSAFGITLLIEEGRFRRLQGETSSVEFAADSGRWKVQCFCPKCGGYLWGRSEGRPGAIVIRAGTLDDTSRFAPQAHIWTKSKQPWVPLPADVPAFEETYDTAELWPRESLERIKKARS